VRNTDEAIGHSIDGRPNDRADTERCSKRGDYRTDSLANFRKHGSDSLNVLPVLAEPGSCSEDLLKVATVHRDSKALLETLKAHT
jgi:hypothetical protein